MTHTRRCKGECKQVKPVSEFYRHGKGFQTWCKECKRKHYKATYCAETRRTKHLWKQYKITPEIYEQMLEDQGGGGWICGAAEGSRGMPLAVDHCHATGAVRGLLCDIHNTGLGKFNDDPVLLQRAIKYLTERFDVDYRADTTTE